MDILILAAGRTPPTHEQEWIEDYLRRASRFRTVKLTRIRERLAKSPKDTAACTFEALKARIPPHSAIVLLDPSGEAASTDRWVRFFGGIERGANKHLVFLIGGSYGLPAEARAVADFTFSLSPLTLPHRVALLILTEQIYRVLSLRAGTPYHH